MAMPAPTSPRAGIDTPFAKTIYRGWMAPVHYEFTAELWLYPGEAGWHFVTLPAYVADEIDEAVGERAGFGSIPVEVTIGASIWKTSLFPDKQSASFVLPVKKAVRTAEALDAGMPVTVRLRHDTGRS